MYAGTLFSTFFWRDLSSYILFKFIAAQMLSFILNWFYHYYILDTDYAILFCFNIFPQYLRYTIYGIRYTIFSALKYSRSISLHTQDSNLFLLKIPLGLIKITNSIIIKARALDQDPGKK